LATAYYNRANLHADTGAYAEALADYSEALRLDPGDLAVYLNRGRVYALLGDYARAVADNEAVLARAPDEARACNNLACLWAPCPDGAFRDGPKAREYAQKACAAGGEDSGHLDTLAAAHAACGEFEEAARLQRRALELAAEAERPEFAARLALYEAGRPYVQGAA